MFNGEIRKLLIKVISSWQVIAATLVLVVYFYLIKYVAKVYHKKRPRRQAKRKAKPETANAAGGGAGDTVIDELGLEENTKK